MKGIKQHGKNWIAIQKLIATRTRSQTRSHAQKFFRKLDKDGKLKEFKRKMGIEHLSEGSGEVNSPKNQAAESLLCKRTRRSRVNTNVISPIPCEKVKTPEKKPLISPSSTANTVAPGLKNASPHVPESPVQSQKTQISKTTPKKDMTELRKSNSKTKAAGRGVTPSK